MYLLQQIINGLTVGCVYALVAMGYTLVHLVIGQINLAHGEILMVGAFLAMIGFAVAEPFGIVWVPALFTAVLIAAVLSTAAHGVALHRLVYRPLKASGSLSPLVGAIGVSIVLQETVRLVQGAGNLWLQPLLGSGIRLLEGIDGFDLYVGRGQLLVWGLTACVLLAHHRLVQNTRFGREQRATAQDERMAALLGIATDRVVGRTFAVAAALAAVAGFAITVQYGVVNFYLGFVLGLKAFTAAILGGIGSLPGAALGGLLLGIGETLWSAYFAGDYRDVAVFALLVGLLIFRPGGLMGVPPDERLPGPGGTRR